MYLVRAEALLYGLVLVLDAAGAGGGGVAVPRMRARQAAPGIKFVAFYGMSRYAIVQKNSRYLPWGGDWGGRSPQL